MSNSKILIIHQGAIGDLILSLPAITVLKKYFSHCSFQFMGYPEYLELLTWERDQVFSIHVPGFSSLYTERPDPSEELKRYLGQFERVIIFGEKGEETLVSGMKVIEVKEIFRIDTFPDQGIHVIDHQASLLSSLGIEVRDTIPRLFIKEEDARLAQSILIHHDLKEDDHLIFLHPGSGSIKKVWPPAHFAQLAKDLCDALPVKIVVIEGPADRKQTEKFYAHLGSISTVKIEPVPLRVLAAILKRGDCFIGNDSGITHLSSAVGTPTIAMFGPTDPEVWGPRGENILILSGEAECSPCSPQEWEACTRQKCLENLEVETVYDAVEKLLSEELGTS